MPTIYHCKPNRNLVYIPNKGLLYLDRLEFEPKVEAWEIEEHFKTSTTPGYIPFEITEKQLETILGMAETKTRLEELTNETKAIFYPEGREDGAGLKQVKELVEKGEYLTAYNVVNKYRMWGSDLKEILPDFYIGLREISKEKAIELVMRFDGHGSGFDSALYAELEARYLHHLEENGRIKAKDKISA